MAQRYVITSVMHDTAPLPVYKLLKVLSHNNPQQLANATGKTNDDLHSWACGNPTSQTYFQKVAASPCQSKGEENTKQSIKFW